MTKKHFDIGQMAAIVFAVIVTVFTLSNIVTNPFHTLIDIGGDGCKNYFTCIYQSLYGKGVWFQGMNYPYGDHIVFTDGQPFVSVTLSYIKNISSDTVIGIMHLLIGISYALAIIFTYKIFRLFNLNNIVAIYFSALVIVFSPQLFSINGHYALGYVCPIPMLFYWILRFERTNYLRYPIYLFVIGMVLALIHPYYVAIILIMIVFYALSYLMLAKESVLKKIKHVVPLLVSICSVLVLFFIIMKCTDPIKDRPVEPYGKLMNCTDSHDLFTSDKSLFWDFLRKNALYKSDLPYNEGYTYPGMVVIVVFFISLAAGIVKLIKRKKNDVVGASLNRRRFPLVWVCTAIATLLFAMGAPFIWHMEWLLDDLSLFKQFRTLGRFSWIFYYIIAIFAVVRLYEWYAKTLLGKKPIYGRVILFLCAAFWSYEAAGYVIFIRHIASEGTMKYDLFFEKNEKTLPQFLTEHNYNKNDFQAIIGLPFVNIGTEKLWVGEEDAWIMTLSESASLMIKKPIVDLMMSRSSWSEAEKQVRIAGGPFTDKPLLRDCKSNKPFLLMRADYDSLDNDQKYLLQVSRYIGHYGQCFLYACYPDSLQKSDKIIVDSALKIAATMKIKDTCLSSLPWYVNHFDNGNAPDKLFGAGAMKTTKANDTVLDIMAVKMKNVELYELSAWFLLRRENAYGPYIHIEQLDSAGNVIASTDALVKRSVDNYGLWFRANSYFKVGVNCRQIRCTLYDDRHPCYFALDELLIRPANALVISKADDGKIMANNHLLHIKNPGYE